MPATVRSHASHGWESCQPWSGVMPELTKICPIFVGLSWGDFNPQKLLPTGLRTFWEWKNRVLLEEYH